MKPTKLIGIDISESSIKVLHLNEALEVSSYGTAALPDGVVSSGLISDFDTFSEILTDVLASAKPESLKRNEVTLRAMLCLPESKLFTYVVKIKAGVRKGSVDSYVVEEAIKVVPYPLSELYYDVHTYDAYDGQRAVFVAAPRKNIDNYVEALSRAGVKPALIGGEMFSLAYSLLPDPLPEDDLMIIDMGAHTATLGIVSKERVARVSIKAMAGGDALTRSLEEALGISVQEAEQLKRTEGLLHKDEKAVEALRATLEEVVTEAAQLATYFKDTEDGDIQRIILAGGSALLPGFKEYLSERLKIPVETALPLQHIKNRDVLGDAIPSIFFANVVGLALCAAKEKTPEINLLRQYRFDHTASHKERFSLQEVRTIEDLLFVLYGYWQGLLSGYSHVRENRILRTKIDLKLLFTVLFLGGTIAFLFWVIITYT